MIHHCRPNISPINHSTRVSDTKQIKISSADYCDHVTLSELFQSHGFEPHLLKHPLISTSVFHLLKAHYNAHL